MLEALVKGFFSILQPDVFPFMLAGVIVGSVFAAIPGIGGLAATILLLPYAMTLSPLQCIALLLGIGAISQTANSYPSVLIAVPGSVGSMATIVDGYPMAQKGQAARALSASFTASALGGLFGAFVLFVSLPIFRPIVLALGSPEFFMFCIWGLTSVAMLAGKAPIKGLIVAAFGVLIAMVGTDPKSGVDRFVFDLPYLWEGLNIAIIGLGIFAVPEMILMMVRRTGVAEKRMEYGSGTMEGIKDVGRHWWLSLRCSAIGAWVGFIPGMGSSVADWFAYGHAVQTEKDNENFGKGDVRGVIAAESANNAKEGGGLIPTLFFGLPGSTSLAIVLVAFIAVGMQPGPTMLTTQLYLVYAAIFVLVFSNLIATSACLALGKWAAKIAFLPFYTVAPVVIILCFIGAFLSTLALGDLLLLVAVSLLGWFMKVYDWPRPPLIIGVVLGSQLERYLWFSIAIYGGTWLWRPGVILLFLVILCTVVVLPAYLKRQQRRHPTAGGR